jgi:hypothetical protein
MEKLSRRRVLRRILTATGGLVAGATIAGCVPGPGGGSYYANYAYGGGGSKYDNYAHRYVNEGGNYIHYGDGH